jgi:uncharacterized protein
MSDRPALRLRFVHDRLAREVEREEARRVPDRFRVLRLKKLKLAVKDRLARSSAPQHAPA